MWSAAKRLSRAPVATATATRPQPPPTHHMHRHTHSRTLSHALRHARSSAHSAPLRSCQRRTATAAFTAASARPSRAPFLPGRVPVRCASFSSSSSSSAAAAALGSPSSLTAPSSALPPSLSAAGWSARPRPLFPSSLLSTPQSLSSLNVAIMGPPGSGKSSVGRELSRLMGRPLLDIDDDVLEPTWGCSVAQQLRQMGDQAFLAEEGKVTRQLNVSGHVLSLSGSNPLDRSAMAHIAQRAVVVYLDCPAELILSRCGAMKVDRIVGQSSMSLLDILRYRAAVYEVSYDVRISVNSGDSPSDIAARILAATQRADHFVSTRGYDREKAAAEGEGGGERGEEFVEVVRKGLAPDRGLFVLGSELPVMRLQEVGRLVGLSYQEKALRVMEKLPLGSLHPSHLRSLLYSAYSSFDDPTILPVTHLQGQQFLMETFHGPTASFKDLSLQLLPHLLTAATDLTRAAAAAHPQGLSASPSPSSSSASVSAPPRVALLVATSGDTGTAAVDGFSRLPGSPVVVLYPKDGVSVVQRRQMQTATGDVLVLGVDGDFDFCQTTVKDIFNDADLARELSAILPGLVLSSANSINWGRFLPQIVFTFASYTRLVEMGVIGVGDAVDVCIPTGNFGNLLGAVYARRMGLPLRRLLSASNTNNVIADFVSSGHYDLRGRKFTATVSPSIDILLSSNIERLLYLLTDGDSRQVADLFHSLARSGHFTVSPQLLRRVQAEVASGWCSEAECMDTIRRVHQHTGRLIDPHTAVAVHVACKAEADAAQQPHSPSSIPMLISSTAHYAKFPTTMLQALTGDASPSLSTDLSALFDALHGLPGVHPLSRQHPQLAQLPSLPPLHTHTVRADKGAVVDEIRAFFTRIAQRSSASAHTSNNSSSGTANAPSRTSRQRSG